MHVSNYLNIDEFLESCNPEQINQVIDYLIDGNYIRISRIGNQELQTISEQDLENALNKLHGKYRSLTQDEEETIIKIGNRF